MKLKIFILLLFIYFSIPAQAKKYRTAWGIRIGYSYSIGFNYGLSFKQYFSKESKLTYNLMLNHSIQYNDIGGTGLLVYHFKWMTPKRFTTYIASYLGIGIHAIYISNKHRTFDSNKGMSFKAGPDILVGSEVKIPRSRFMLGLDFKPFYQILGTNNDYMEIAISLHYTI